MKADTTPLPSATVIGVDNVTVLASGFIAPAFLQGKKDPFQARFHPILGA